MEERGQDNSGPEERQEGEFRRIGPGPAAFQPQPDWPTQAHLAPQLDDNQPIKRRSPSFISPDMLPSALSASGKPKTDKRLWLVGLGIVVLVALVAIGVQASGHGDSSRTSASGSDSGSTAVATTPSTDADGNSAATSGTTATAAVVGSTISLSGSSGTAIQVTVVKVIDPAAGADEFDQASAGDRLVAVQLQIKNTGTAVYADDPDIDVTLIDSTGQQYQISLNQVTEPKLNSGLTLGTGQSTLGVEVFEVGKSVELSGFQYQLQDGLSRSVGQWKLS